MQIRSVYKSNLEFFQNINIPAIKLNILKIKVDKQTEMSGVKNGFYLTNIYKSFIFRTDNIIY